MSRRRSGGAAISVVGAVGIVILALLFRARPGDEEEARGPDRPETPQATESRPVLPIPEAPAEGMRQPLDPPATREPEAEEPRDAPSPAASARLQVRVLDPWDRPRRDGNVVAWLSGSTGKPVAEASVHDGVANLSLPMGIAHRIEASQGSSGFRGLFDPASLDPAYSDWREVTLRLGANCARVSGRVVAAETREVLDGVGLSLFTSDRSLTAQFGLPGDFDLVTPPGGVDLTASAPGRQSESRSLQLARGEWVRDLEIPLRVVAGVALVGKVTDREGAPIAGARVTFAFAVPHRIGERTTEMFTAPTGETRTDRGGGFAFRDVPLGRNAIEVSAEGYEPSGAAAFRIERDGEEIEVILACGGRVRIRGVDRTGSVVSLREVVFEQDGAEILRADRGNVQRKSRTSSITGTATVEGPWGGVPERPVFEEGFLVVEGVPPGMYNVAASAEGREGTASVVVVAGESVDVEIRLDD